MRCKICDATLNPSEIAFNPDHEEFDPCGVCLDVIDSVFEDHVDEDLVRTAVEEDEQQMYGEKDDDYDFEEPD